MQCCLLRKPRPPSFNYEYTLDRGYFISHKTTEWIGHRADRTVLQRQTWAGERSQGWFKPNVDRTSRG